MAGNRHMQNLDDGLIARLKRREVRHGRSTEAEHREILRQTLIGDIEPCFGTLASAGGPSRTNHPALMSILALDRNVRSEEEMF